MSEYEVPSEALLSEVWNAAQRLGYLTTQVDQMLENRAKAEKRRISREIAYQEADLMRQMVQNDISLEEYAEQSVSRLCVHMDAYAEIEASHRNNSNRFKQQVQAMLEEGKLNAVISFTVSDLEGEQNG